MERSQRQYYWNQYYYYYYYYYYYCLSFPLTHLAEVRLALSSVVGLRDSREGERADGGLLVIPPPPPHGIYIDTVIDGKEGG